MSSTLTVYDGTHSFKITEHGDKKTYESDCFEIIRDIPMPSFYHAIVSRIYDTQSDMWFEMDNLPYELHSWIKKWFPSVTHVRLSCVTDWTFVGREHYNDVFVYKFPMKDTYRSREHLTLHFPSSIIDAGMQRAGCHFKKYYDEIEYLSVTKESGDLIHVKTFDASKRPLFQWTLDVPDPCILQRLYELHGSNPIDEELVPYTVQNRIKGRIVIEKLGDAGFRIRGRDRIFTCPISHHNTHPLTLQILEGKCKSIEWLRSNLHQNIAKVEKQGNFVFAFNFEGRKLFAWMLSPGKPAVTRKEIEDLQKMYGTELFSLRKGPKQVAEWSEKNFPHVNYLRVCDGSLAGYKYYEPVFSIDIEKLCE